jgi:DNA-binding transcriptional regulator YiaG
MTHIELKQIRINLGLTQKDLAARLFKTKDCIAKWESGKYPIPKHAEFIINSIINEIAG